MGIEQKTHYSKLVDLKKRFFPKPWVPSVMGAPIDSFFNHLHNARIVTKDRGLDFLYRMQDVARDSFIRTRDLTRDSLIRTKDLTRDSFIRTRDLTRDSLIRTKDLTRDSFIHTRDLTRDSLIRTKDLTRDSFIHTRDLTRDSLVRTRDLTEDFMRDSLSYAKDSVIVSKARPHRNLSCPSFALFGFYFLENLFHILKCSFALRKHSVTEKSDQEAVREIQKIVVNSRNIKSKVAFSYHRDSEVVNPPIETRVFESQKSKGYWLSVNRLTPEKRIEMQLTAFSRLPNEQLIIVGGHSDCHSVYVEGLKEKCPVNVDFTGAVEHDVLVDLYAHCKGFLTTAKNEDFGMNVVEAMAAGKPVIAPNEGGFRETVAEGTGILISDIDEDKLIRAIRKIGEMLEANPLYFRRSCREQAARFDVSCFVRLMREQIGAAAHSVEK